MYTSSQIADWILSRIKVDKGDTISPLKLQKLLYYCQAWHLVHFRKPLFDEDFQAWVHGPVLVSQFHRFMKFPVWGAINIGESEIRVPKLNPQEEELLNEVFNEYGEHSGSYLEDLTHSEKPWIEARGSLAPTERSTAIISKTSMQQFYTEQLHSNE
jgi:uncharacterized phage-associated protein